MSVNKCIKMVCSVEVGNGATRQLSLSLVVARLPTIKSHTLTLAALAPMLMPGLSEMTNEGDTLRFLQDNNGDGEGQTLPGRRAEATCRNIETQNTG